MAEYIEREALSADIRESYCKLNEIYETLRFDREREICRGELGTFCEILMRIKDFPAADVVEVVRCKDCKHMEIVGECNGRYCHNWGFFNGAGDDGFCNYGERRESNG